MHIVYDYIQTLNQPDRDTLQTVYDTVLRVLPEVEQKRSYGLPTFTYKGKYLIALASNKKHLSIYPGSEVIEVLSNELSVFETSKGTIRFTSENPLSTALVERIVDMRKIAIDTA